MASNPAPLPAHYYGPWAGAIHQSERKIVMTVFQLAAAEQLEKVNPGAQSAMRAVTTAHRQFRGSLDAHADLMKLARERSGQ